MHRHTFGAKRSPLWIALIVLALISVAAGDVFISLPTEGRYRAGRYLPVRLIVGGEKGPLILAAAGAVPTELQINGDCDVIVPWLAVSDSIHDVRWTSASRSAPLMLPLRPLSDDERLIALAGVDADAVATLFPGKTLVPISLDLSRPLLEPVSAWETLDAAAFSDAAFARLAPSQVADLLAAGAAIAVESANEPRLKGPWKKLGALWVLRHESAGTTSIINADAYEPTYAWRRGWPAPFRRQVIVVALVFVILACGVTLWRSRFAAATFILLAAGAAGAFAVWYGLQSPVLRRGTDVLVKSDDLVQYDFWTWVSPVRGANVACTAEPITHPIFDSDRQIAHTGIRLVCDAEGRPRQFAFHLDAGAAMAMLTRMVRAKIPAATLKPASPPIEAFADQLYTRPGDRILGEFQAGDQGQPTAAVVVESRR